MSQTNHYITTYQKDYTWPYESSQCRTQFPAEPIVTKGCTCVDSRQIRKELTDGNFVECFNWSRMGPMGRLLEPKIYTNIERVPEANVTRFSQLPSIYFYKEEDGLYGALKKSPLNETVTRTDVNRMKTTYQVDYSHPAAARKTQRDIALTVVDKNGQRLQCSIPIKITVEADCPSYCHLPSLICNGSTSVWKCDRDDWKRRNGLKRDKKCEDIKRKQMLLPSWKSEYQDSINKIGQAIMRVKLHQTKKKGLPILYQYCTTTRT